MDSKGELPRTFDILGFISVSKNVRYAIPELTLGAFCDKLVKNLVLEGLYSATNTVKNRGLDNLCFVFKTGSKPACCRKLSTYLKNSVLKP